MISSDELRSKYVAFFASKGHAVIPSASLVPENDPTVLFTTAGMHPLVPYLMGEVHPSGKRLTDVQKCIRTGDIDSVGDAWHLTFFEMLGNWSLGDYFKKEALTWSYEFLTTKKGLGLDPKRLHVSCFAGDADAPKDTEAAAVWESQGIPKDRIHFLPKADNWWGPAGATGPCGPDSEMFYDTQKEVGALSGKTATEKFQDGCSKGRFVEIWNDVFMQYQKTADGKFVPLQQKNVDTGMGLERTVAVLNGKTSVYDIDSFAPLMKKIESLCAKGLFLKNVSSARIIADHVRSAVFILGDPKGVVPSNTDQGYVLRRLIRRAVRHGKNLGIEKDFLAEVGEAVVKQFGGVYAELSKNRSSILDELSKEEQKFKHTLSHGLALLHKEIDAAVSRKTRVLDAKVVFDLYQSYGFPPEMTQELSREKGIEADLNGFESLLSAHQDLSRKGAEQKFKGGLADHSVETTKLHTATHLLNAALRKVLGDHVYQKGSNITAERLRFDFPNPSKLTDAEVKEVEDLVNQKIKEGLAVKMEILPLEEAKRSGAMGVFEEKYGAQVKVYTVFNPKTGAVFSKELCGGPHVQNTADIGHFRIVKEEGVAAGVRRIKAVVEPPVA
jgi:alanyl-tRNA synthetase